MKCECGVEKSFALNGTCPICDEVSESTETAGYVAILERHDYSEKKAVMVPPGQSLEFDTGRITRMWLHKDLGSEWHLVEFIRIAT